MDKSRVKIGKQAVPYRIGPLFAMLLIEWVYFHLSDEALRRLLKKEVCVKLLRMQLQRLPATLDVTSSNPGPGKINLNKN